MPSTTTVERASMKLIILVRPVITAVGGMLIAVAIDSQTCSNYIIYAENLFTVVYQHTDTFLHISANNFFLSVQ